MEAQARVAMHIRGAATSFFSHHKRWPWDGGGDLLASDGGTLASTPRCGALLHHSARKKAGEVVIAGSERRCTAGVWELFFVFLAKCLLCAR